MEQARPLLPGGVTYCRDAFDAAQGADALVLITEWNEFRALSPTRLRDAMRGRVLVDLRNVYDPVAMRQAGFDYHCVGRPENSLPRVILPQRPAPRLGGMDITVCICTHDRPGYLRDCLDGLRHQTVGAELASISWSSTAPPPADGPAADRAAGRGIANARLVRVDQPASASPAMPARRRRAGDYIAYIDDDAIPADGLGRAHPGGDRRDRPAAGADRWAHPAAVGSAAAGMVAAAAARPLSIIELEGQRRIPHRRAAAGPGTVRRNMVVHVPAAARGRRLRQAQRPDRQRAAVGRGRAAGLAAAGRGHSARYDSRIVVQHQIQAARLTPAGCCRGCTGRAFPPC